MLPAEEQNGKNSAFGEDSHQHQNQSKSTNPFLPAEIIYEILSRLPVKSLLKFKSVEKSWLALISSPEFIKFHLSLSANNNINHTVTEESDLDYLMKHSGISFSIEGSVNGLICLVNKAKELYLWNPAIRKYKKLPDCRTKSMNTYRFTYGFGYDKVHDDYKIVQTCIIGGHRHHFQEVNMYSLKNDSWRVINFSGNRERLIGAGKFVNGKIYWASTTGVGLARVWGITSFDLADEKWRKVGRPCGNCILVLGVLGSNFSMICNNLRTHIDVWAMKEYNNEESWMKMFTINYSLDPTKYFLSQSLCFSKRGEFLLMFKAIYMIYNPKENSIRYSQLSKLDYGLLADFYIQSLVFPLSQNEPRTQQD